MLAYKGKKITKGWKYLRKQEKKVNQQKKYCIVMAWNKKWWREYIQCIFIIYHPDYLLCQHRQYTEVYQPHCSEQIPHRLYHICFFSSEATKFPESNLCQLIFFCCVLLIKNNQYISLYRSSFVVLQKKEKKVCFPMWLARKSFQGEKTVTKFSFRINPHDKRVSHCVSCCIQVVNS